jgi:hypothetical protein
VTEARRHNAFVLAILAIVPILIFLDVFLGINGFYVRDVMHYYYPAKKVLREIVLGGHFPYWNPWFSAGQPMAANPEHEVFYPLNWLILLPDYVHAFQLLPLVHVLIATFTMYALLRSMDLGRPAACLGAISFGVGGLLCSMLILFPYLFSIAWLPLTCLYARRYLLHRAPRDFALAAFFLGLQLLVGEPTTAFQSGVLLGLYAIYRGMKDERTPKSVARRVGAAVGAIGAISIVALLVAAVQVIPTIDFFGDTARARGIDFTNVSRWSTPFQRLAELVYPNALGHHAALDHRQYWASALYGTDTKVPFYFSIYSGLLLTVMAAAGVLARRRGAVLVLTIAAISVIAASGVHTPLLRFLYDAGVAATLRYPEKFVLMLVFAIIVFGAQSFDRLLGGDEKVRRAARAITIATTVVAAALAIFSFTSWYEPTFRRVWSISPSIDPSRVLDQMLLFRQDWLIASARGVLLLLLIAALRHIRRPLWVALAGLFVIVDLGSLAVELTPRVPLAFYRDPPVVVRTFPAQRSDFRIFHIANWSGQSKSGLFYRRPHPDLYWIERNGLAPMTPATYGLQIVISGDFDLTELVPTDDFTQATWKLEKASSGDWLNVVVAMSNIRYVGIHRRPEDALALAHGVMRDVQPVKFIEGAHQPRYYFANEMEVAREPGEFVRKLAARRYSRQVAFVGAGAFAPARGVVRHADEWTNGARLDVQADGRAFLVMSVTPHKYWRITVDGQPRPAVVTNLGYQGVVVPGGRHVVEMRYHNPLIAVGGAISIATLLALAWAFCRMRGL